MLNVVRNDSQKDFMVTPSPNIRTIFECIDQSNQPSKRLAEYRMEVELFYLKNRQPQCETKMRVQIWKLLSDIINPAIANGYLALGGSTINKFGTIGSDLDMCFALKCTTNEQYDEAIAMHTLIRIKYLLRDRPLFRNIRYVDARVPILKIDLNFPYNGIEIDINCNCAAGIYNTHLLSYFSTIDKRVPIIAVVLKRWASTFGVVDPRHGKLNSYTVILMIIHFLQCGVDPPILPNLYQLYPRLFNGTANLEDLDYKQQLWLPRITRNNRTVGELIFGFFNYYAQFDYENWGISIKEARLFDRSTRPESDRTFLFFLEEAYDGMTVPKNLTRLHKLADILHSIRGGRRDILSDLYRNEKKVPTIDTSNDYRVPGEELLSTLNDE